MTTPDYTAQAQALIANARVVPYEDCTGYLLDFTEALNLTVDVRAASIEDARLDPNVVSIVAQTIERRQRDA